MNWKKIIILCKANKLFSFVITNRRRTVRRRRNFGNTGKRRSRVWNDTKKIIENNKSRKKSDVNTVINREERVEVCPFESHRVIYSVKFSMRSEICVVC